MEANSFYEQKHTAEQALKEMVFYYNIIKSVGGSMITIWHNTFLGNDKMLQEWKNAYIDFIKLVSE